eukprot:133110-Pelagomonas_calceolata.AAC.1
MSQGLYWAVHTPDWPHSSRNHAAECDSSAFGIHLARHRKACSVPRDTGCSKPKSCVAVSETEWPSNARWGSLGCSSVYEKCVPKQPIAPTNITATGCSRGEKGTSVEDGKFPITIIMSIIPKVLNNNKLGAQFEHLLGRLQTLTWHLPLSDQSPR